MPLAYTCVVGVLATIISLADTFVVYCQRLLSMRNKRGRSRSCNGVRHVEMYFVIVCLHPENSDLSETIGGFLDI